MSSGLSPEESNCRGAVWATKETEIEIVSLPISAIGVLDTFDTRDWGWRDAEDSSRRGSAKTLHTEWGENLIFNEGNVLMDTAQFWGSRSRVEQSHEEAA